MFTPLKGTKDNYRGFMVINETLTVDIKELEKRIAVDYTGNSEGSAE